MGFVDTVKDVVTLVQKTDNIELVKHVLSLQTQALDMQDENRKLRDRALERKRWSLQKQCGLRRLSTTRRMIKCPFVPVVGKRIVVPST
ncbi:MAG: hypothetical protein HY238_22735 [Acidobacteria bacterium]|nr:hypothetical protein [Acidobacteriota bacterium]